jgi:DNA invertase Pin-like site-specific DNA recombinase
MIYTYSRVSTNNQQSSTEQQEQYLLDFCQRKGFVDPIHLIDSDISGGKPILKRPEGSKLSELKSGDVVVCSKHDRMFRSLKDAVNMISNWFENGITIYLLNIGEQPLNMNNPSVKLQLYIMMAVAENELDTIRIRTKENLQHRKNNLKTYSSAPYGWDNNQDGTMTPNINEQNTIIFMKECVVNKYTFDDIASILNGRGKFTKKGKEWRGGTIYKVINNPLNKNI